MAFSPLGYQAGDVTYPLSVCVNGRLRKLAKDRNKGLRDVARVWAARFLTHARYVNFDLSKLEFQHAGTAPEVFFTASLHLADEDVLKLCAAGRFDASQLLELSLSLVGLKQEGA